MAICIPGPETLITGFSNYKSGFHGLEEFSVRPMKQPLLVTKSLATGEELSMIGVITDSLGGNYFVLDRESFPGESGSGLLGIHNCDLFVLKGGFPVSEDIKKFMNPRHRNLTVVALIGLK
ncbi:MAG: hypothetical protein EXS48_02355 [Candidatus Staskawiczbacteria bacterium]|nr:hypothetical protein [Candidatus Staskawiczbacteria bacterium]